MASSEPVHRFLAGRYNKYTRDLSQTPWIDKNDVRVKNSLQELIEDGIFKYIKCEKASFSSSGREDVDVRMLGTGRPFVFKLTNPSCTEADDIVTVKIEEYVNSTYDGMIKVRFLQFVSKEEVAKNLTIDEENNISKKYGALCCCSRVLSPSDIEKVNNTKNLVLDQRTPIRVLHRRTLASRPKTIYNMSIEFPKVANFTDVNSHHLTQYAESGTYIKEFVHGDFGRTTPNLAILLGDCETDIMELDVLEVVMEWPRNPSIKSDSKSECRL
ncbi:putative tRNA pseudouridine synthase Pus10, partial [Fragariocoptes setiger]